MMKSFESERRDLLKLMLRSRTFDLLLYLSVTTIGIQDYVSCSSISRVSESRPFQLLQGLSVISNSTAASSLLKLCCNRAGAVDLHSDRALERSRGRTKDAA